MRERQNGGYDGDEGQDLVDVLVGLLPCHLHRHSHPLDPCLRDVGKTKSEGGNPCYKLRNRTNVFENRMNGKSLARKEVENWLRGKDGKKKTEIDVLWKTDEKERE